MNTLLVEPKPTRSWGNKQHVGLLRIGHWLESTGHEVKYVVYPNLPGPLFFSPEEVYVTSMFTYDYPAVWEAVRACKETYPNATVKLGGIYATICYEHALLSGADEVHRGRHPEARFYAPNPTLLPKKPTMAYLFSSYGCDRACTYCATYLLFDRIEQTDPDTVVDEVEYLADQGYKRIRFGDDNLLFNAESHINVICEKILERGLKLNLEVSGGMTARGLTRDTLTLMRQAGFKWLSFGLESISEDVLRNMGRKSHTKQEHLERTLAMCDELGFTRRTIDVFFMIGLPYQRLGDMIDTLVYLLGLGVWAHPQRLAPIPNTREWKRMGLEDWDYKDLHYNTFVSPDQNYFTDHDLRMIYRIARTFNMGSRMASNTNWLTEDSLVHDMFREKIRELL